MDGIAIKKKDIKMEKTIILSTDNPNKIRELSELLEDYKVLSKADMGLENIKIKEGAESLEENALLKLKGLYKAILDKGQDPDDYIIVADDTGLFVEGLEGDPGVKSARYAGEEASDFENLTKLLKEMENIKDEDRSAYFSTVIAFCDRGQPGILNGILKGRILKEAVGNNGFGYDPVFFVEEKGKSLAQMTDDEKNSISHRGRALSLLIDRLAGEDD